MIGIPFWQWGVFFLTALLFRFFPGIDLWVSGLFYHDGFVLAEHWLPVVVYFSVHVVMQLFGLGLLISWWLAWKREQFAGLSARAYAYLFTALILGPVIINNVIFKSHSGRPRPRDVDLFGGAHGFLPVFDFSGSCSWNCSFVCGHCGAGFYFIALAFLFTGNRRINVFLAGLAVGVAVSFSRIVQGAHFLSDAVFAFIFTYIGIRIAFYYFYQRRGETVVR